MALGRSLVVWFGLIGLSGQAGPALAQAAAPPDAPATDVSRQNGSLSDKLNATGGVIHPEGAGDAGIQKAPAVESRMPVIPPANAPGVGQGGVAK